MTGSVLQQKSPFKIPELSFSSKFDWGSHIISTGKIASKHYIGLPGILRTIGGGIASADN